MKRATLALGIISFALTVTAAPRPVDQARGHRLGLCYYENVDPVQSVPEVTSSLALAIIGMAAIGVAASLHRKKI
jgi:hypothetical protein